MDEQKAAWMHVAGSELPVELELAVVAGVVVELAAEASSFAVVAGPVAVAVVGLGAAASAAKVAAVANAAAAVADIRPASVGPGLLAVAAAAAAEGRSAMPD